MIKAEKTKSGKWRVRVEYKENGKRRFKSFTSVTKKDARAAANHFLYDIQQSTCYDEWTLAKAYERYCEAKKNTLSPRTYSEYKRANKRDFPELMNIKLKNLTPEIIQTAVSDCCTTNAPKTVRNKHGHLVAVLKMYRPSLILNTKLPQSEPLEIYVPTSSEVKRAIENANDWLKVPILLASSGSLRRSEVCAITPEDITAFGVRVNKAAVYDSNKKLVIKPPKTKAGDRLCPLPKEVLSEVRAWDHFGITPNRLEKEFQKLKEELGLRFRFHDFRHYFASELHSQGIPDQYIIKAGGWSSVSTLQQIYQHTLRDKEKIFDEKIVNIFSAELSGKEPKKAVF